MPRLISISGSVHSGKTTVSRMLAVQMPSVRYLDGDMIAAYVQEDYPKGVSIDEILPEIHTRIIAIIRGSLIDGMDIIVDYPLSDQTRQQILNELKSKVELEAKWFLLKPEIEKVLSGSKNRPELNDWETERIKRHYSGPLMQTELAIVVDSTNQTPEETTNAIREEL